VTGSSRKNRFFVADPGTAAGSSSHGFQVGKFSDRSTFWRSGDVRLVAMKVYGIFSLLYGMTLRELKVIVVGYDVVVYCAEWRLREFSVVFFLHSLRINYFVVPDSVGLVLADVVIVYSLFVG
jgi:hypothetical protein